MTFEELAKHGEMILSRTSEEDLEAILSGELSQVDLRWVDDPYLHPLYDSGELIKRIEEKGLRYYDTTNEFLYVGKATDNVIQMIRAMSSYDYGMCYEYPQEDIAFFYLNAYQMNVKEAEQMFEWDKGVYQMSLEKLFK
jgi:hypothetical protein